MIWFLIFIALAAFLFRVSRKPNTFSVERSIAINAPASDVFGWINNVKRFNQWNPWAQMDPTSTIVYTGPEEGPQASYSWEGKKTGKGSMTLTDQRDPAEVNFDLKFLKPFKADNRTLFTLREGNGVTIVVWTMTGRNSFLNKLFQTFMNMDKMVGKDFDKGLAALKQKAESRTLH